MTMTHNTPPEMPPEILAHQDQLVDEMLAEGADGLPDGITEEALDQIVREVWAEAARD